MGLEGGCGGGLEREANDGNGVWFFFPQSAAASEDSESDLELSGGANSMK